MTIRAIEYWLNTESKQNNQRIQQIKEDMYLTMYNKNDIVANTIKEMQNNKK